MKSVKVLLVESHNVVRFGLKSALETDPGILVVGEATGSTHALNAVSILDPDVIVMTLDIPGTEALESARRIKQVNNGKKVLMLSMTDHENCLRPILSAGADGCMMKHVNREELVFAVRKVASGGSYISAEFTRHLVASYISTSTLSADATARAGKITAREMDVLRRVADGKTNAQIAQELFTSVRTIETRWKNLLDKTGTTNTATLIRYAVRTGLID